VRIHTCVLVRPCCRCQRHSYRTRSTNDGVELPDGTPRGVRDLYPVWLPRVPRALPAPSRSRASLIAESPSSPLRPFLACGSRRNCRDALRQADARVQTTASVLLAETREAEGEERNGRVTLVLINERARPSRGSGRLVDYRSYSLIARARTARGENGDGHRRLPGREGREKNARWRVALHGE